MTKRFIECEYKPDEGLVLKFKPMDFKLVPDATREHLREAAKETLFAMRSLLDAAIECTEHGEKTQGKARTKIEVK